MATILGFKDQIDIPDWRPLSIGLSATAAGRQTVYDLRNDTTRDPYIYSLNSSTINWDKYSPYNDEWVSLPTTTIGSGNLGAGTAAWFAASHGPSGLCAGSPTTTSFTLGTALPFSASAAVNQLANKGNGVGYTMRVIGKGTASSGKTEYVTIIANTASTTPVVTFTPALTWTPNSTDSYEILSGRAYIFAAGTLSAGQYKAYDIATATWSGNLTTTNYNATPGTDACTVMLDELFVPSTRAPGEGFFGNLIATGSAAGTLTGTVAGGDSAVLSNEYRNFQIRIVTDTVTPTAVGQRRKITSHTAGASPVYTLASNWTVTPTATCTFVIENANDVLIWTAAATVTYSNQCGGFAADGAWSTAAVSGAGGGTQWANPAVAHAAGVISESCFSITQDPTTKNARHSHIVWFKTTVLYQLDIAGGANGVWTTMNTYGGYQTASLATGTTSCHDAYSNSGKYMYINVNGTQRFLRFDMLNRTMEPWCYLRFTQSTAVAGSRMACYPFIDGATKVGILFYRNSSLTENFNCIIQR